MATLTIRNLNEEIRDRLRIIAAQNGHSMEEEVRRILGRAVHSRDEQAVTGLGSTIRAIVMKSGHGGDLALPKRSAIRNAPLFGDDDYDAS